MNQAQRSILSIDIGSSSCKAVIFDDMGNEITMGKGYYDLYYSNNNTFVEQNPQEIWTGVCDAILRLDRNQFLHRQISAISLTAQISSHFLIDSTDRPLINAITWMDSRAELEAEEMKTTFSTKALLELLGAEMPTGASWPIPKLRWLHKHNPSILEQSKYIIQPKEWVLWQLTSEWRTDLSSMRGLVHQMNGKVCKPLLDWAGVGKDISPPISNPYEIVGVLRSDVAQMLQLSANIPVFLGWNDLNAAVLGSVGIQKKPCGFDITGTSEHIGVLQPYQTILCEPTETGTNWIPFIDNIEMRYGVTSSGGQALKWYVEQIDQMDRDTFDYSSVIMQANDIPVKSEGLIFLPYLHGERSPWWNPAARGVFFGIHATHNRQHMARAVMEGVGYALRTIFERLGVVTNCIRVTGGSSKIPLWNQIKADILGIPWQQIETSENGCLGAAILAAYGLGWYNSLEEASSRMIRISRTFDPRTEAHLEYDEGYAQFVELYEALAPLFLKNEVINTTNTQRKGV